MPFRPFQKGKISTNAAYLLSGVNFFLSLLFSLSVSWYIFILIVSFILLTFIYSIPPVRFVGRGFLAQLHLAFTTGLIPLIVGALSYSDTSSITLPVFIIFIIFFLFFSFFLILKDFKDYSGDKKTGKKTILVELDFNKSSKLVLFGSSFWFFSFIALVSLYRQSILFFLIGSVFLYLLIRILKNVKIGSNRSFSEGRLLLLFFFIWVLLFNYSF